MFLRLLKDFRKLAILFLILGVFGFYSASIAAMHHQSGMAMAGGSAAISQADDCGQPASAQDCVAFHLGLLHDLTEAASGSFGTVLVLLAACVIVVFAASVYIQNYSYARRVRIKLRQLYEKVIDVFITQLGYWLTILEKRDPEMSFVLA